MGLLANQTVLADAIYALNKPVMLVLESGRPFAIPEYYNASAAVRNSYFGGQSGGRAITDVLFGAFNPGARLPLTIPRHIGQLPVYYNYKATVHAASYVDIDSTPAYPFWYGVSYSNFSTSHFTASVRTSNDTTPSSPNNATFSPTSKITFSLTLQDTGPCAGSHVPQIYLLQRVSLITQPVRQLVAFTRVYLEAEEMRQVQMELEVDRYLGILNRRCEWEVEKGGYVFALAENGGVFAYTGVNVTMKCI